MSMDIVYLDGAFMPADAARISPRDRGFRFGDGIFETIPFYRSAPYQWGFHLGRLEEGLEALQISVAVDWREIADQLIAKNKRQDGFVRIAVSRGVGSRGYRPLASAEPTIFSEVIPRSEAPGEASLWLSDWRKPALACLPQAKLAHGINSTLALLQAETHGCDEALLLTPEGMLCEAASGNVFWIKDDALYTPELSTGCLKGATRHAIIRLHAAAVHRVSAPLEVLEGAEAVFLSNCNWGILPASELQPLGWQWSVSHSLIDQLRAAYKADIDASV